jgi:hypothetical protein
VTLKQNADVQSAVEDVVGATTADWVMNEQPCDWSSIPWHRWWNEEPSLPHASMLDTIETEVSAHGRIRRRFVFDCAAQDPIDLFIATMAWGYGADNRRVGKNLRAAMTEGGEGNDPTSVLVDAGRAMRMGSQPMAEAFRAMFSGGRPRLPRCNVAFATKVLHFLGYDSNVRPRPLIYDQRVARALARVPDAPYLPHTADSGPVRGEQYEQYCQWAEAFADERGTESIVVEYALFEVGGRLQ